MRKQDRKSLQKIYCPVCGCLLEALEPYDIETDFSFEYFCCDCCITIVIDIEEELLC